MLLGVTGSGKTFTMANVIASQGRPALVMAPNKTLAAQLYAEMKGFFPENAVEYFVSYYDYYQPEAYVPRTDTFIEKDSSINEQIDRMRHSATRALMERDDVIIVASVSCIYGIGPLENYQAMTFRLHKGQKIDRSSLLRRFVEQQYKRNDNAFQRGTFRVRGDTIDLFPAHYEDKAWRFEMFGDEIDSITEFDPLTGDKTISLNDIIVYANSHYVTPKPTMQKAIDQIKADLKQRLEEFNRAGRLLEAQRLEQRTLFDIEMLETTGSCAGIENYSRYLTGRKPGRAAAHPVRILSQELAADLRREPRHGAADRRHVPRRLQPQECARRVRLPPALGDRQPAAEVRGVGRPAAADHLCQRHPGRLGDGAHPGHVHRTGDPSRPA